ncbi:hypothetical protein P3X46_001639 [Hevea brasiliensis]|uniref:S-protein homolog n=1 Tax=Hevea brasiliensis TaxID=3981 RepID=A0ABQ9NHL7_HEVBR|nr:S-protein homolog 2-like [Hevea brasiliensis]KAJ9190435.1 hypothetical protein P3X46_001639 [Hevea brasiliensis]
MVPTSWAHLSLFLILAIISYNPVLAWRPTPTLTATDSNTDGLLCFKFRVHVINGLSSNNNPLLLHCESLDDDLGNHTLYVGGDFNFKFGLKVLGGKTIFTCDFKWDLKHQHVFVFRDSIEASTCCVGDDNCYWRAQDDGIYFKVDGQQNWEKQYDWLQ